MDIKIERKINKVFNVAMIIFAVFPFLFLTYGYLNSNGDIVRFISSSANVTISFIVVMMMPFIALTCKELKEDMSIGKKNELVVLKLIAIMISQILFFNIIGIALIASITLKVWSHFNLSFTDIYSELKISFKKLIGVGFIVLISGICFILSILV